MPSKLFVYCTLQFQLFYKKDKYFSSLTIFSFKISKYFLFHSPEIKQIFWDMDSLWHLNFTCLSFTPFSHKRQFNFLDVCFQRTTGNSSKSKSMTLWNYLFLPWKLLSEWHMELLCSSVSIDTLTAYYAPAE